MTVRKRKILKPAETDGKIRNPSTDRHLASEGEEVVMTSYWIRRLRDGDVIEADARAAQAPAPDFSVDAIGAVLEKMDPADDGQWTKDGLPKLSHIENELGVAPIKREQVAAVAPAFNRDQARGDSE